MLKLSRRLVLGAVVGTSAMRPPLAQATPVIPILIAVASALAAAAAWASKFAKDIDAGLSAGYQIIDRIEARALRATLNIIGTRDAQLQVSRSIVITSIEMYREQPDPSKWSLISSDIIELSSQFGDFMDECQGKLGPQIGSSPAYNEFVQNLGQKRALLRALATCPPPQTPEELRYLDLVNQKQRDLRMQHTIVITALNKLAV